MSTAVQVFASHTKLDKETCDKFDVEAAGAGVKVFRSEYEEISPPAWKAIRDEIKCSSGLFLLIGPELVKSQEESRKDWKYTQNWIAYEIGVACAFEKDVWVVCDKVNINFPVPYLNNYCPGIINVHLKFEAAILEFYKEGGRFPLDTWGRGIKCPYEDCGSMYNLHMSVPKGEKVICPTCLRDMVFDIDWLVPPTVAYAGKGLYIPKTI